EGLGKNFLLEENRQRAVEAYRLFTRYYALTEMKDRAQATLDESGGDCPGLLDTPSQDAIWERQRRILAEEGIEDVGAGLSELCRILERLGTVVEAARGRDDRRGSRIMEDYAEVHAPAEREELVRQHWQEMRRLQAETERVRARWQGTVRTALPLPGPHHGPSGECQGLGVLVDSLSGQ